MSVEFAEVILGALSLIVGVPLVLVGLVLFGMDTYVNWNYFLAWRKRNQAAAPSVSDISRPSS